MKFEKYKIYKENHSTALISLTSFTKSGIANKFIEGIIQFICWDGMRI